LTVPAIVLCACATPGHAKVHTNANAPSVILRIM